MVSVVVVTKDGAKFVATAVSSVLRQTLGIKELIVVDNASKDETLSILSRFEDSRLRVVGLKSNVGLAAARNIGAAYATGEYVVFIDQDVRLEDSAIQRVVERMSSDGTIGAAQGKILIASNPVLIDGLGIDETGVHYGEPESRFTSEEEVLYPHGGFSIFRRDVWDRLGGYGRGFFFGHEDEDLGWRVWEAGYRSVFVPTALAYHVRGSAGGRKEYLVISTYGDFKGYLLTVLRNLETRFFLVYGPALGFHVLAYSLVSIPKRRTGRALALIWFLQNPGFVLQMRRQIQSERRVSDAKIMKFLRIFLPPMHYVNWRTAVRKKAK